METAAAGPATTCSGTAGGGSAKEASMEMQRTGTGGTTVGGEVLPRPGGGCSEWDLRERAMIGCRFRRR